MIHKEKMKHIIVCIALLPLGIMAAETHIETASISIRNTSKSFAIVSLVQHKGKIETMKRWKIEPSGSQSIFIKKSPERRPQFLLFDFDGYQVRSPFTHSQRIIIRQPIPLVPSKPTKPLLINLDWDSSDADLGCDNDY
jgi:hypothetical protein